MELDADQTRLLQIFNPYHLRKRDEMQARGGRFVHYTTAEVSVSIIKNQEIWMRKSTTMNDFMEIEHGLECIDAAYNGEPGAKFKEIIGRLHPGFCEDLDKRFDSWKPVFRDDTFLACISEHDDSEDGLGRLSMWRAYGGSNGVAIVLNNGPFLRPSDALNAYTSAVAYLSKEQFKREFSNIVSTMEGDENFLSNIKYDTLLGIVFKMFQYAALSTKHPGFHEEREWQIIHSPIYEASTNLRSDIVTVRGTPQPIYKIPLQNFPEEGLIGATIPELLDRLIIGPTGHPGPAREAFVTLLDRAGVPNAHEKVVVSQIPLRQ